MRPLNRFLAVLEEVGPHIPKTHPLFRWEAARQVRHSADLAELAERAAISPTTLTRCVRKLEQGRLAAVVGAGKGSRVTPEGIRLRLAQLLLGALTEERFQREKEELTKGRLTIEDHRLGRTDTDYRVLNGGGRPIFRINIKFHGTAFVQAQERVGLDPADCFALATYKIHQALTRQREEALPYVFLVLSCLGLTSRAVSELIPHEFTWFIATATKFPKRDLEEAVVARLLTPEYAALLDDIRRRILASEFRVLSASRAERLVKEKLFERVFALRQRGFTQAFRNAELDMHFSLARELTPVREFLSIVAAESPQRLTVLLDRGEIA